MIGYKETFSFSQLHNQYIIIFDDEKTIETAKKVFPSQGCDNAILTYCYIDSERGVSFEVLCMVGLTPINVETEEYKIDFGKTNDETSFSLTYSSVEGKLLAYEPNRDWKQAEDYRTKVNAANKVDENVQIEVLDMRAIRQLDSYRHEYYPDDLAVYFLGENKNPEIIWCKGFLDDDGRMQGCLLDEPWDASIGRHKNDVIELSIMKIDGTDRLVDSKIVLDTEAETNIGKIENDQSKSKDEEEELLEQIDQQIKDLIKEKKKQKNYSAEESLLHMLDDAE